MHFDENHINALRKLIEVDLAVSSSFNSSDDGDKFLIGGIKAHGVAEPIAVEVTHVSCFLTIDQGECRLGIPSRAPM